VSFPASIACFDRTAAAHRIPGNGGGSEAAWKKDGHKSRSNDPAGFGRVLLLNDHVLKEAFHNWLTGKLSDFAGVAAFALFWCMLFPNPRRPILLGTAAAFAF
jgi:hypothetical protein